MGRFASMIPTAAIGQISSLRIFRENSVTDRRIALRPAGRCLIETAHDTIVRVCDKLSLIQDVITFNEALPKSVSVRGSCIGMGGQ